MAQLSFNCFQNKNSKCLACISSTAWQPTSQFQLHIRNTLIKHYFQQKREKKVDSNHDHECSIKIMNQTALICIKYPIKNLTIWPWALQWSLWLYIHVYDILLAIKNSHRNNDFCNAQNNFNQLLFSPFYFYQFDNFWQNLAHQVHYRPMHI